jgi:hypothetical protein
LASLSPCCLSWETRCFHSLLHSFRHTLRLSDFFIRGCRLCGIFAFACSFCRLPVNAPFCYCTRLLHRQICWLFPLAQILFLALLFLFLPLGLYDEGHSKKHLLLFHRRRLLLSFLLHFSVVYKNIMLRLFAVRMTWLLLTMMGACMLSESFLRIDSLILPNFQWNRWVGYLTRTVLRRWGVTASFAWLLLLFLLVSILLVGNLITIELALATHHTSLGHVAT